MSIRIMAQVWDNGPENQGELLVLLALADFADDDGACWPSMDTLARKARIQERSARRIVRRLEADGWVSIDVGNGRHGCNRYVLKVGPRVPRTQSPPDPKSPERGTLSAETRTGGSPEPSRTINEPSLEIVDTPASVLEPFAGAEAVTSFLAYRRKSKAGALTMTGAKRLAKHLQTINTRGGDAADALGLAEERGWRSVEADWYFKENRNGNGNRNSPADDPTLRAIARAASRFDA